jgi:hypothetical protein
MIYISVRAGLSPGMTKASENLVNVLKNIKIKDLNEEEKKRK